MLELQVSEDQSPSTQRPIDNDVAKFPQCQETKPSCDNCLSKELQCAYPSQTDQRIIRRTCIAKAEAAVVPRSEPKLPPSLSEPTSFSMDDMRCFHHFLTVAYPHLPLGNDSVWVQEIPLFAQQVRQTTQNKFT